jgi:ribosomal-protein-alanine N-acetyltransferase
VTPPPIRRAGEGDAARIDALARAAGFPRWSGDAVVAQGLRPHHVALVAGEGEARGFALGSAVAGEAEVLLIAVDPAHRRAGLGAALLAALEGWAEGAGAEAVYLEVAVGNRAARALYAGAGYVEVGVRRGYYGDGAEDALCLRRALGSDRCRLPPGP